jgi:hypothetical protein
LGVLVSGAHPSIPTRTVPLSPAAASTPLPSYAVQGPGNSLWYYWQSADAQWHGPLGIGGPGSTNSAPAMVLSPAGLPTVAVQGPGNSLWVYWETADAQWHGPYGVGPAGAVFSSPSMVLSPSGLPTIAVQGPGNSLWLFWETPDAQWHGPYGVGAAGSTYASPSAVAAGPGNLPTISVQGPGNSLWLYWQTPDAQWHGPYGVGGPGAVFSAPSSVRSPNGLPTVAVQGPGNSLWLFWQTVDAQWHGPYGVAGGGSTFGSPQTMVGPNGLPDVAAQGPGNALWMYWQTPDAQWHGPLGVGGGGASPSVPMLFRGPGGLPTVATVQPDSTLWIFWETADAQWHGPYGVGGDPPPAGAPYATMSAAVTEGGSGTGYSAYINMHDAHSNAISVGIQTDTADPHSQGTPWYIFERVQNGAFSYQYLAPASPGAHTLTLSWWGSNQAVYSVDGNPIATIGVTLVPRLFFQIEGDARLNGDSVNDTFTNAQIAAGNNCPTYCGLNGAWNTSSFNYFGLAAHDTNGAPQNGANFTVTGTSNAPGGDNWDNSVIAGIGMIAQYWAGQ